MQYRNATLAAIVCALALIAAILTLASVSASLARADAVSVNVRHAHEDVTVDVDCAEDEPCWNWNEDGNGMRGIVTMWGTPKTVTCGELRWLARHGDLDPRTPWLKGDYSCGRRHSQDSVLDY